MHDLQKDCERSQLASRGPWVEKGEAIYDGNRLVAGNVPKKRDRLFIIYARQRWAEDIKRAMAAEARVKELETVAKTASRFNSTKSEVDWLELQMALAKLEGKPQYDDHFCLKDVAYQCKSCGGNVYKTPISSYPREHNIEFCIDCLRSVAKAIIPLCEIRKYGYITYLIIPSYKHWFYEIQLFKETKWGHESGYYHFTDLHLHDVAMKVLDFLIKKKQKEETPRALAELEGG